MYHQTANSFTEAARRAILAALGASLASRRGLLAGTCVETPSGWREVETLLAGDLVCTQDGAARPLTRLVRTPFEDRQALDGLTGAVLVPEGVLGCAAPFVVLPDQCILIDAPGARSVLGRPHALLPGRVLAGHRGIEPVRLIGPLETFTPCFARDEVIRTESGLIAHCPAEGEAAAPVRSDRYRVLSGVGAEALLDLLDRQARKRSPTPFRSPRQTVRRRPKPATPGRSRRPGPGETAGQAAADLPLP